MDFYRSPLSLPSHHANHPPWSFGSRGHWGLALDPSHRITPLTHTHAQGGMGSPRRREHNPAPSGPVSHPRAAAMSAPPVPGPPHTGYGCPTRRFIWHGDLRQPIKVFPRGKEAGWISDKQVASASSSRASLLISSDLESNRSSPSRHWPHQ